jgi:hypothetical protein
MIARHRRLEEEPRDDMKCAMRIKVQINLGLD